MVVDRGEINTLCVATLFLSLCASQSNNIICCSFHREEKLKDMEEAKKLKEEEDRKREEWLKMKAAKDVSRSLASM
jgi:uncharacterized membrane protein YciS (DUF1049 family)